MGSFGETFWYHNIPVMRWQGLVPQRCSSRAASCPCLPRAERWAGCCASVDAVHPLDAEQLTNQWAGGSQSDVVTRLRWGVFWHRQKCWCGAKPLAATSVMQLKLALKQLASWDEAHFLSTSLLTEDDESVLLFFCCWGSRHENASEVFHFHLLKKL